MFDESRARALRCTVSVWNGEDGVYARCVEYPSVRAFAVFATPHDPWGHAFSLCLDALTDYIASGQADAQRETYRGYECGRCGAVLDLRSEREPALVRCPLCAARMNLKSEWQSNTDGYGAEGDYASVLKHRAGSRDA